MGYEGVTSTTAVPMATGAESGWFATPGQGKTNEAPPQTDEPCYNR